MYYVTPNEQRTGLLNEIIGLIINLTSISTMLDPDNSLGTDESIFERALYLIYFYAYGRWSEVVGKVSLLKDSFGDVLYKVFLQSF